MLQENTFLPGDLVFLLFRIPFRDNLFCFRWSFYLFIFLHALLRTARRPVSESDYIIARFELLVFSESYSRMHYLRRPLTHDRNGDLRH